jgi:hypothetical protein
MSDSSPTEFEAAFRILPFYFHLYIRVGWQRSESALAARAYPSRTIGICLEF